ncbi:MAG: hypothetical protein MI808_09820 [Pseudomonadales bacterium]|nr:hypothetical protein [Pseudomonadales bacterium]
MWDIVRELMAPYYMYIKFIHVMAVMIWSWSTAVAYTSYLKNTYIKWKRNPNDAVLKERRDWAFEQFDRGVVLEHIAFPVILVTGAMLFITGNWNLDFQWLAIKLSIVALIFLPMEVVDYYLSHMGGNKYHIKKSGNSEKYEQYIEHHWLFFRITTPLIATFMPIAIFFAIVKPSPF